MLMAQFTVELLQLIYNIINSQGDKLIRVCDIVLRIGIEFQQKEEKA